MKQQDSLVIVIRRYLRRDIESSLLHELCPELLLHLLLVLLVSLRLQDLLHTHLLQS